MKKVIGIILMMVMVFMTSVALCDAKDEIINYCKENTHYFKEYIEAESGYNIVGKHAYAIASFDEQEIGNFTIHEFMEWYNTYFTDNWPELAKDVKIDCTYAGHTENYRLYCIWLELNNGKTFNDYIEDEPDVSLISGLLALKEI